MNKSYSLTPLSNGKYKYLSYSLTSERLDDYCSELEAELRRLAVKGRVLLDLLISNGQKNQRFASVYFDGNQFNFESFEHVSKVDRTIKSLSRAFYKSHISAIDKSVLTQPQKFLFKRN
jgi:hypothetical protein